jgi:hypothetical protein
MHRLCALCRPFVVAILFLGCSSLLVDGSRAGLTLEEREAISAIANKRPSISLEFPFEYRSSSIAYLVIPRNMTFLTNIGRALSSPELKGATFMLAGHTAPEGPERYNQTLSERRAEAIKRFLVENYDIPAETLVTVGYGSTRLRNPEDPFAPENRRVEIVNMSDK